MIHRTCLPAKAKGLQRRMSSDVVTTTSQEHFIVGGSSVTPPRWMIGTSHCDFTFYTGNTQAKVIQLGNFPEEVRQKFVKNTIYNRKFRDYFFIGTKMASASALVIMGGCVQGTVEHVPNSTTVSGANTDTPVSQGSPSEATPSKMPEITASVPAEITAPGATDSDTPPESATQTPVSAPIDTPTPPPPPHTPTTEPEPSTPFDLSTPDGSIDVPSPLLPYTGVNTLAVQHNTLHLNQPSSFFGQAMVLLPDFTGDGLPDIAIGAPSEDNAVLSNGYVYILSSLDTLGDVNAAASELYSGDSHDAQAGHSLATGDFNSDGLSDLLIGAPSIGKTHLIFGHSPSPENTQLSLSDHGISFHQEDSFFGHALAGGDVNGDGFDDVLIGDPLDGGTNDGAVHIFLGKKQSEWDRDYSFKQADISITGSHGEAFTGSAISVGDLTGGGAASIAVGAMGYGSEASATAGAVAVFFPRTQWPSTLSFDDADLLLVGESPGGQGSGAGNSVLLGCDINGDNIGDLIVGASGFSLGGAQQAGRLYLFRGGSGYKGTLRLSVADGMYTGQQLGDEAGFSMACAGDVNRDGYDDVLVNAVGHSERRGQTYLLYGSPLGWPAQGDLTEAGASWIGSHAQDESGRQCLYYPPSAQNEGRLILASPRSDAHGEDSGMLYSIEPAKSF